MKKRWLAAAGLVACSSGSPGPDAGPPAWHVVLHDLTPTLLCAWGTSPSDVFAVGGPLGNGTPSAILHYDGHAWSDLHASGTDTFWWANGTSDTDVWAVGENGRIARWDGAKLTGYPSGTTATLYGVFALATDDVWAVGGTPEGGTGKPNDVLLHFDGTAWTPSPLPKTLGRTFFKVWGTGTDNLYVVGEFGTIWHRTGTTWALEAASPPLATGNLTTVSGCSATEVYAVGGNDVLVSDGTTWTRAGVTLENGVNGVACASPGNVVVVGFGGLKQRLVGGRWQSDFGAEPHGDFHGAWADPSGAFWAVGGDFASKPAPGLGRSGTLAVYGTATVEATLLP